METTEYLLKLSREAEAKTDELSALISRISDLPIRSGKGSVYSEIWNGGGITHEETYNVCTRIIEQRSQMFSHLNALRAETEILTSIADDVVGKTGRLV